MRSMIPLRHGLKSAWHHRGLVLLVYLTALLPALVGGLVAFGRVAPETSSSLFAREALGDDVYGVISDYNRGNPGDLTALETLLPLLAFAAFVLHVMLAAGVVETLLEREAKREHPFLLGVGRHSWRFLRSALPFLVLAGLLVAGLAALFNGGVDALATQQADGRIHVWGALLAALLFTLVLMPLDLGYDLSRIAAATHDEGRTFVGYFKALGHALRHPLLLAPTWLFFNLVVVGLHVGYLAFRLSQRPASLGPVLGLLAVQQLVFLLAAFFRVGLWGAEVAYYQGIGEPRWCEKRRKKRRQPPQVERREPLPVDPPVGHDAAPAPAAAPAAGTEPAAADPAPAAPAEPPSTPPWEDSARLGDDDPDDDRGPSWV